MLVKEIMSKHPDALSQDTTLKQAASEMQKHDFGFLPVKQDGHIAGIVTDRDIVIRALAKGLDPNTAKLKEIMSKELYYCHEDDDIKKVSDLMCKKQINRLMVYDKNEKLSGILSVGDIARKCKDISLCGKLSEAIHHT